MFANFHSQPILKQMALLAGVGAGAFWLGSRVVASHEPAAAHSVEPVHLVARAPEAGRTTGKERSFAPPRIEAAEADSAPGTPDTLVAKSDPATSAKPLEVTGHLHPTTRRRSACRCRRALDPKWAARRHRWRGRRSS